MTHNRINVVPDNGGTTIADNPYALPPINQTVAPALAPESRPAAPTDFTPFLYLGAALFIALAAYLFLRYRPRK